MSTLPHRPRSVPAESPVAGYDGHPGHALPARQERSRDLRDRLVASTRALIDDGGFAGTSMAQIARAAGCSVGVLYQRFSDKDALFDSVVQMALDAALAQQRGEVAQGRYQQPTLEATVQACVQDYVGFVRRHEGLVRAIYQRTLIDVREWVPLRGTAYTMVQVWVDAIVTQAAREGDAAFRRRAMVAFQFASGALIHAVLVQPIVVGLHDDELLPWLVDMMTSMLKGGLPVAAASPGRPSLRVVPRKRRSP